MKIAVITPYFQESLSTLQRCHQSVLNQSELCTHFLVADGPQRPELLSWECRNIALGRSHHDNGNTPRGIGSICAMNEGFDCIMFLDADNWYEADHAISVLYTQSVSGADVIFSGRHIVFPNGEFIEADDPEDLDKSHVDTSCMSVFSSAYRSLSNWCLMPQELGPWCDRIMFALFQNEFRCEWTGHKSVNFETWYTGHFELAGKEIPPDAKKLTILASDQHERINSEFRSRSYCPCELTSK